MAPVRNPQQSILLVTCSATFIDAKNLCTGWGRLQIWGKEQTGLVVHRLPGPKESSLGKQEMLPDIDHIDIGARQETLAVRGEPTMVQFCVIPAYALTIHKTQVGDGPTLMGL